MIYMKNDIKKNAEHFKAKADLFLKLNKKVFLKDSDNQIYMCFIKEVFENSMVVKCFSPPEKNGKEFDLYFLDITNFKDYKDREEMKQ